MGYRDILKEDLEDDEGRKESVYQDSLGYWTIGVGRLVDKRVGGHLRPVEIDFLLKNDMDQAEADARTLVPNFDRLSERRQAAIANLTFNMGFEKLSKFVNTLRAIHEERWEDAAQGLRDSKWARQVQPSRVKRVVDMIREG